MTPIVEDLPRILVFSDGCMSPSHGTGAIFLRNFSQYPPDRLCNAFVGSADSPGLPRIVDLNAARWPRSLPDQIAALPARIRNRLQPQQWRPLPVSRRAIARALQPASFAPDLIYAVCWGAEGLATLEAVLVAYPSTPLLVHFHDIWPSSSPSFGEILRRVAPRITAAWGVSASIARYVTQTTGLACGVEPQFHIELPPLGKQTHRAADAGFRTVVIGNFWNESLVHDLKAVWAHCQRRLPWLAPVEWYGPADAVARLRAAGIAPEPEIKPMGFLRGDALWTMLSSVDLALIPFSREATPANDYERYSLPSRITELAAAGLPIFGLTGPQTPLAEYLTEKQIGHFVPAGHTTTAGDALHDLILNTAQRETLGRRARALAEAEFPLGEFQRTLYTRLAALAAGGRR